MGKVACEKVGVGGVFVWSPDSPWDVKNTMEKYHCAMDLMKQEMEAMRENDEKLYKQLEEYKASYYKALESRGVEQAQIELYKQIEEYKALYYKALDGRGT